MSGTLRVYFIWYGGWGNASPIIPLLTDFVANLGGSGYYAINTLYGDAAGGSPANSVVFAGAINDNGSRGTSLSESDVDAIVGTAIAGGSMPSDPSGVYVVLPAADVAVTTASGAESGSLFCAARRITSVNNVAIKYAYVPYPGRMPPSQCQPQTVSPNGSPIGDAMVSILANIFANTVTDPLFSAWYDRNGLEPADKCAWSYGTTYTTANGARANVRLGSRDFLLQQLWIPAGRGYCALEVPPT